MVVGCLSVSEGGRVVFFNADLTTSSRLKCRRWYNSAMPTDTPPKARRFRKLRIAWSVVWGYRVRAADRVVGAELLVRLMSLRQ